MAREKPKWRRVMTTRYIRWWLLCRAVAIAPALGRWLAFFPKPMGMIEGADRVLADEKRPIPAPDLADDLGFLTQCFERDTKAPDARLPDGLYVGRRTVIFEKPWIDATTASVLLPNIGRTVMVRGETPNWNAISARPGRPRVTVEGRAFAPLATSNYFHLLVENGIRLIDLLESGLIGDQPLTIAKRADRSAVEAALYDGLAKLYMGVSIRHVPDRALVLPDEAVAHFPPDNYWEWPPVTREHADVLGEVFDAVYGAEATANGPRGLYLSRAGAKLRSPINENELEAKLDIAGAPVFIASDANHPEQIARFRAARVVVAVHGAGLTNILFCAPGTKIIEIFPRNFVKSTYWRLAQVLGLEHQPIIAGAGNYDQHFEVDADEVVHAVERAWRG